MATYYGYMYIPHNSYTEWKDATIGNMYDVDGWYSGQCWDYCALCYYQYGLQLVTKAGGGVARDCWVVSRAVNSQPPFESVYNKTEIKRGDILVFGAGYAGHICFADEDYNGTDYIRCLGQNQRGGGGGYPATLDNFSLASFLGAFRNTNWQGDTPEPEPEPEKGYNKHRYNFVLFNRRKRQEKWTKKPLKRK